jgi:hypothetical protein
LQLSRRYSLLVDAEEADRGGAQSLGDFTRIPRRSARETVMTPMSDMHTVTLPNTDAREAVTSAFEAMEKWRDEIVAVNERHLEKALDLVAGSQRALGWPDHVTTATREYLLKASKIQTQMIGEVMDAWQKQLKSFASVPSLPEAFRFQMPAPSGSARKDSGADMTRFQDLTLMTPFMLWMQAAEMWQRNWAQAMTGSYESRGERVTRRAAS